ncbi:ATP-binding protein [Mesobaculum littorinae]|uniref:ATP-binding protein n=1 Tax=Mesobaculum littorinae TaxID=2486419 RepID=A0A438ADI9_9RHOB|nr:YifB family Mg chelatase-like AAA ATPase [Mesobaculum littorinae]RVV96737.1 ATP-binding protein [Mesobaculum littorinae]
MATRTYTVAFEGIEARLVEVQCAISPGLPAFTVVGLPDKAVSEAKERVRSALGALSIALPSKRITVNLSPADIPKAGSHFDLPIALALLSAIGILPPDVAEGIVSLGELSLDGTLVAAAGALPAAMTAAAESRTLICPAASGPEAAWVTAAEVLAPTHLSEAIRHYTGQSRLPPAEPGEVADLPVVRDLCEVKGQERARRALEIAAAGRHHMLMVGPPGAGKSTLAKCLPGLLPPLSPEEALETSMILSLSGMIKGGGLSRTRPFQEPHHTASSPAIIGGGRSAAPGQVSLAHNGVLFLDELPEFARDVLDALRQPLESGEVMVARANAHVRYPCRVLLVAAANPCRCGHLAEPERACARAPECGEDYMGRISGPLIDRFDLRIDVPPAPVPPPPDSHGAETSATVAARVGAARRIQADRYAGLPGVRVNADATGDLLGRVAAPDDTGLALLTRAAERFGLTARGYHKVLRVARTIADLEGSDRVGTGHLAEALSYRFPSARVVKPLAAPAIAAD